MSSHRIEIVKELRALEQFCTFKAVRTGEESERFLKDYLADIQAFPFEAIQKACAEWRRSGATRFPTPGQLIPIIRKHVETPDSGPRINEPWKPLSEAEYAALGLEAKIRHRRILAAQARDEATIHALREGWDRNIANAPASYHRFMAVADAHEAEAKRLGDKLREAQRIAAE